MALYTAIGSQFKASLMKEFDSLVDERIKSVITQTLKQVAHDYDLDYKALKIRYCSKESLVEYVTVDLNEARHEVDEYAFEPEPEAKAPVPEAKAKVKVKVTASKAKPAMALSKMKKSELVEECEVRGLDSEGTVSQLRERLKDSRDPAPVKTKKKVEEPVKKKKVEGDPVKKKAVKKKKVAPVPAPVPPPHVALEEEEDEDEVHVKPALAEEEDEDDEDVCRRVPVDGDGDGDGDEFEVEDDDSGFEKKLRAILLEAGELEEEEDDDDEIEN